MRLGIRYARIAPVTPSVCARLWSGVGDTALSAQAHTRDVSITVTVPGALQIGGAGLGRNGSKDRTDGGT